MDTPFVGARAPRMDAPSDRVRTPWDARRVPAQRDTAALPIGRGRRRQDSAFPHAARGFSGTPPRTPAATATRPPRFYEGILNPVTRIRSPANPARVVRRREQDVPARAADAGAFERLVRASREGGASLETHRVLSVFEGSAGASFMTAVALWTLFGDDARLAAFDAEDDHAFVAVTYACLALFTAEMCALCVAKEGYAFGFYFWLDLVATASLLLDVPEFMDASGLRSPALCDFVESASGGLDVLAAPDAVAQADDDGETVDGAFLRAGRAPHARARARAHRARRAPRARASTVPAVARARGGGGAPVRGGDGRDATFARRLRGDCRRDCRLESTKGCVRRRL